MTKTPEAVEALCARLEKRWPGDDFATVTRHKDDVADAVASLRALTQGGERPTAVEVGEADIPAIIEAGRQGAKLTPTEASAWTGYEIGWRDGNNAFPPTAEAKERQEMLAWIEMQMQRGDVALIRANKASDTFDALHIQNNLNKFERLKRLLTPAAKASPEGVERAARIIDPEAWAFHDRHKFNPVMKAEIAHETRKSRAKAADILGPDHVPDAGNMIDPDWLTREQAALAAAPISAPQKGG